MARTETDAALFGIAYLGVADLFSKGNSSPQTTEINAKHRVATLMKWVNIESVESIFLVWVLALTAQPGHRRWPIFGGLLSLVITYGQYLYAKSCGMNSNEPGTEDFGPANGSRKRPGMVR
jgi:hypothetical protein